MGANMAPKSVLSASRNSKLAPIHPTTRTMNAPDPLTDRCSSEPIRRAYEYLNQVRTQFLGDREVYDRFVELMGKFKMQTLGRMEVIERVAELFAGHHQLLSGFNQFLPEGYRLEPSASDDPPHLHEVVIVTPEGRYYQGRTASAIDVGPGAH